MAWQIMFEKEDGEKVVVDLDDLSPDVFEQIAREEKDAGLSYWGVYSFPKSTPSILYAVLCAAAEHAGVSPPDRAASMRAINEQNDLFSEVPDIADQPSQDGFPQVPGETESGSSSGAPGDSDGTENSANDSQ
jgi:hypothetical protein